MAAAGAATVAVFTIVALTAWGWHWADDPQRTELAQWIMASSSAATLVAAVVAAVYAAGAFKLESDREDRWHDTQRRAQASVVAAWATTVQMRHGTLDTETGYLPELGPQSVKVELRNASDVPVTDVRIEILMRAQDAGTGVVLSSYVFGEGQLRLVPPGETPQVVTVMAKSFVETHTLHPMGMTSVNFHPFASLEFRDASGVRWLRTHEGLLLEMQPGVGVDGRDSPA